MTSVPKQDEISTQIAEQWTGSCSGEPGNTKLDPLPCFSYIWDHVQSPPKRAAGKWFQFTVNRTKHSLPVIYLVTTVVPCTYMRPYTLASLSMSTRSLASSQSVLPILSAWNTLILLSRLSLSGKTSLNTISLKESNVPSMFQCHCVS